MVLSIRDRGYLLCVDIVDVKVGRSLFYRKFYVEVELGPANKLLLSLM